jgi:hypothetical protein
MQAASHTLRGLQYELAVLGVLAGQGMTLTRVGGPGDRGVDLRGSVQAGGLGVGVVVQCKCVVRACGPETVQAFEAAVLREQPRMPSIGIVASSMAYVCWHVCMIALASHSFVLSLSRRALEQLHSSRAPLAAMHMTDGVMLSFM